MFTGKRIFIMTELLLYRFTEIPLKTVLDALPAAATFEDSWSIPSLAVRFDHLKDFAGGLVSPFPHTAIIRCVVKSDVFELKSACV